MFLGHYAAAFAAKRYAPTVSLGLLVICAQFIDLLWRSPGHLDAQGMGTDVVMQSLPCTLAQHLGIRQAGKRSRVIKDDSGNRHRPSQGPAACLIDPSDEAPHVPGQRQLLRL